MEKNKIEEDKIEDFRKFLRNFSIGILGALILATLSILHSVDPFDTEVRKEFSSNLSVFVLLLVIAVSSEILIFIPKKYRIFQIVPHVVSVVIVIYVLSYQNGKYSVILSKEAVDFFKYDISDEIADYKAQYKIADDRLLDCNIKRRFAVLDLEIAKKLRNEEVVHWDHEEKIIAGLCEPLEKNRSAAFKKLKLALDEAVLRQEELSTKSDNKLFEE